MSAVAVAVVSNSGDQFAPLDPGASEYFYWDFTAKLKPGETVVSAVVTSNQQGDYAANPAMINGTATVMNGTVVRQMINGGMYGVSYILKAIGTTSLGQNIVLTGILPIGPEVGVVS